MRIPPRLPWWVWLPAAAGAVTYARAVHRYRDPVRLAAPAPGELLVPADGPVSFVRRVTDGRVTVEGLNGALNVAGLLGLPGADGPTDRECTDGSLRDGWLLGLHVRPQDVRFVTAPLTGQVRALHHRGSRVDVPLTGLFAALTGQGHDLLTGRGALENERVTLQLTGPDGPPVTLALVAPGRALNARAYVAAGEDVQAGRKLAFLPEGGLVLIHLPEGAVPQVSVGERVQANTTVLARPATRPDAPPPARV